MDDDKIMSYVPRSVLTESDAGVKRFFDGRIELRARQVAEALVWVVLLVISHFILGFFFDGWLPDAHKFMLFTLIGVAFVYVLVPFWGVSATTWLYRIFRYWREGKRGLHDLRARSSSRLQLLAADVVLVDPLTRDDGGDADAAAYL